MALDSVLSRPGTALVTANGPLLSLRHGQILSARIDTFLPNGAARLTSPAGGFEARLPPGLAPGTQLELRVLRSGQDVGLIILNRTAPPASGGTSPEGVRLSGTLQAAIGAREMVTPHIPNPGAPQAALGGDMKAVLLVLQSALRSLLGGAPNARQGSAKAAPPLPGTAAGASPVDLRALSSPEIAQLLLAQTGAAMARMRLTQVASAPDDHDGARSRGDKGPAEWTFELAFAIGDKSAVIQFNLSREQAPGGDDKEAVWRIGFSLYVEPLGPVHAAIVWRRRQVAVTLWAETDQGARRLRREAPALNAALDGADLGIERVQVLAGRPEHGNSAAGAFVDRVT